MLLLGKELQISFFLYLRTPFLSPLEKRQNTNPITTARELFVRLVFISFFSFRIKETRKSEKKLKYFRYFHLLSKTNPSPAVSGACLH